MGEREKKNKKKPARKHGFSGARGPLLDSVRNLFPVYIFVHYYRTYGQSVRKNVPRTTISVFSPRFSLLLLLLLYRIVIGPGIRTTYKTQKPTEEKEKN